MRSYRQVLFSAHPRPCSIVRYCAHSLYVSVLFAFLFIYRRTNAANVAVKRQLTSFGSTSFLTADVAATARIAADARKMSRASTTATSDGSGTFPLRRDRPRLLHTRTAPVDEDSGEHAAAPSTSMPPLPPQRKLAPILSKREVFGARRSPSLRRLTFAGVDVSRFSVANRS